MDIHLLEIFIQAAREGSISKTAKKLNYAQSNVTNKVQQLEAELQTTLFYRHKKGITLTPSGEVLVSYTEKILNMMDEARAAVRECFYSFRPSYYWFYGNHSSGSVTHSYC
ncbi:LysR family transcriptional regulator [Paenibacillus amylolyticus]|nr:LysR family transcriptional regulator [Paenibacillus amylolyticus]